MKTLTKSAFYALVATSLLSACSRPYATFQKTTPEHFYTKTTTAAPAETPVAVVEAPTVAVEPTMTVTPTEAPAALAAAQTQLDELMASTKTDLATTKKLTARLHKVQNLLAATSGIKAIRSDKATGKMGLLEKMVTKRINKQIEKKMAPNAAQTQSAIRLGIIVGIIGLLLIIIGNSFFRGLGVVALVIGLLGILLGYLDVL